MKNKMILIAVLALAGACNQASDKTAANEVSGSAAAANATLADTKDYTTIEWLDSTKQDFGVINEGQVLEVSFRFRNTGDKPLIVTNASASCGCTVAEKPEKPIMPGEEGVIRGKFDSKGRVGPNHKDIYVTANTKPTTSHDLNFTVDVRGKS